MRVILRTFNLLDLSQNVVLNALNSFNRVLNFVHFAMKSYSADYNLYTQKADEKVIRVAGTSS